MSIAESVVEFEENRWAPRKWQELIRLPGNETTAVLQLAPYINYQFRVVSVNAVGRSQPSEPSERYETPPAGMHDSVFCVFLSQMINVVYTWEPRTHISLLSSLRNSSTNHKE